MDSAVTARPGPTSRKNGPLLPPRAWRLRSAVASAVSMGASLPPAQGARTLAGMFCGQELELVEARRVIKRCSWWGKPTPTSPCTYCQEEATRYAREAGGSVGSRVDVHTHWYTCSHIHTNSHTDTHTLTRSCIHSQTRRQICTHSNIHSLTHIGQPTLANSTGFRGV